MSNPRTGTKSIGRLTLRMFVQAKQMAVMMSPSDSGGEHEIIICKKCFAKGELSPDLSLLLNAQATHRPCQTFDLSCKFLQWLRKMVEPMFHSIQRYGIYDGPPTSVSTK